MGLLLGRGILRYWRGFRYGGVALVKVSFRGGIEVRVINTMSASQMRNSKKILDLRLITENNC